MASTKKANPDCGGIELKKPLPNDKNKTDKTDKTDKNKSGKKPVEKKAPTGKKKSCK